MKTDKIKPTVSCCRLFMQVITNYNILITQDKENKGENMLNYWLNNFIENINNKFRKKVIFIGIQGSYARGEANENSDIDVVVIFDELSYDDIKSYDEIISAMPMRDKICGFISGKQELENWDRSDLFQFYHDTLPLYGDLNFIKHLITDEDTARAVKIGACNIYHMCVHNAVHEKSCDILKSLLKSAYFTIQAKYYLEHGEYIRQRRSLIENVSNDDKEILLLLSQEKYVNNLDSASQKLINWASNLICN